VLWLVPGLALTKYRCEFVNLNCIFTLDDSILYILSVYSLSVCSFLYVFICDYQKWRIKMKYIIQISLSVSVIFQSAVRRSSVLPVKKVRQNDARYP